MPFEFATAGRIIFGRGSVGIVGALAKDLGRRAFVITGRSPRHGDVVAGPLESADVSVTRFRVEHEPTTDDIARGVEEARVSGCDIVIAIGGGSVIDAGKAVAAMLVNDGPLMQYLEVIGDSRPLLRLSVPCIAIPTTAGTGAEVTRNAVLASPAHRVKVSLRSPFMLPRVAIVDPELTLDLPPAITAVTGLDALTQLIEPYVSSRANPLVDGFCVEGMRRVARSLRRAFHTGGDLAAREDMALASLYGGLALANAGLGAVHGFAGPIGGAFPAAHGAICAALLPGTTAMNLRALRQRAAQSPALGRYGEAARLLTGVPGAGADDLVAWLAELVSELQIPRLSSHGMSRADLPLIVDGAIKASSMKANPLLLTPAECTAILEQAL